MERIMGWHSVDGKRAICFRSSAIASAQDGARALGTLTPAQGSSARARAVGTRAIATLAVPRLITRAK
jgi:hypothetical protein